MSDKERAEKLVDDLWGSNLTEQSGTLAEVLEKQFAEVRADERMRILGKYDRPKPAPR
jgi:hypothetical protein